MQSFPPLKINKIKVNSPPPDKSDRSERWTVRKCDKVFFFFPSAVQHTDSPVRTDLEPVSHTMRCAEESEVKLSGLIFLLKKKLEEEEEEECVFSGGVHERVRRKGGDSEGAGRGWETLKKRERSRV